MRDGASTIRIETAMAAPVNALARHVVLSLVLAGLLAGLGWWPSTSLAGRAGQAALIYGLGCALVGAWVGCVPWVLTVSGPPMRFVGGFFIGLGLRFVLSLGLALVLRVGDVAPALPLALWVGLAQLVFLGGDVLLILRQLPPRDGGAA